MDYRTQPRHQSLIALAKVAESLGLRSKYVQDGLWGIASIKQGCERVGV
jgi:hypothetical protein